MPSRARCGFRHGRAPGGAGVRRFLEQIIGARLRPADLERLCAVAFLHDFGKLDPDFQALDRLLSDGNPAPVPGPRPRHDLIAALVVAELRRPAAMSVPGERILRQIAGWFPPREDEAGRPAVTLPPSVVRFGRPVASSETVRSGRPRGHRLAPRASPASTPPVGPSAGVPRAQLACPEFASRRGTRGAAGPSAAPISARVRRHPGQARPYRVPARAPGARDPVGTGWPAPSTTACPDVPASPGPSKPRRTAPPTPRLRPRGSSPPSDWASRHDPRCPPSQPS